MPIRAAIITVSDRCVAGEQEDLSGPAVFESAEKSGFTIVTTEIVSDDRDGISKLLARLADSGEVDLILTTGGTGFSPRDNTPEATLEVIDKPAPGLAEAMRIETRSKTPMAMISRAVCGIRKQTLIVNLPGSPSGARECFDVIAPVLPHAVKLLRGEPHSR